MVLKAIDLFFFPSITEGNPNALIEAMIAGVNIIASDTDPHRECTPDSYHQYLVPVSDYRAQARQIDMLLQSNEKNFGVNLQSFADTRFDANVNFSQFLKEIQ